MKRGSAKQSLISCLFSPHYFTVEEITERGQAIIYYPITASLGYYTLSRSSVKDFLLDIL
jgi:hypothetical protein